MRIALGCKETLFGDALTGLLNGSGYHEVVAKGADIRQSVVAAKKEYAQVIIVDSAELERDDFQFLLGAKAFGDFEVVLVAKEQEIAEYRELGFNRIVSRSSSAQDLYEALAQISPNQVVTRPRVREGRKPYGQPEDNTLSRREYEVAELVATGLSNRKISQVTGLREQSVKNLVSVVMRKLGCENRVQVALRLVNAPVAKD